MFTRLRQAINVLLGRMKPVPDGYILLKEETLRKERVHAEEQMFNLSACHRENRKLQHSYTVMTEHKEAIRRKLRKERMRTCNLLSVVDYVMELWTVDAYPSGESMLYAMQFLQEELKQWDEIKRIDFKELQQIRDESVDEQQFRDKIHQRYQELRGEV